MEFKNITDNQNIVFFDNEGTLYEGVAIKASLIVTDDGSYLKISHPKILDTHIGASSMYVRLSHMYPSKEECLAEREVFYKQQLKKAYYELLTDPDKTMYNWLKLTLNASDHSQKENLKIKVIRKIISCVEKQHPETFASKLPDILK